VSNIILPANSAADSAVELRVPNALNFMGSSDDARFQRTNASSGSSTQATLSAWIKYSGNVSQSVPIFMAPDAGGDSRFYIQITSAEEMGGTFRYPDCDFSSTNDEKLRDPAAWYHIVAVINTNDGTAADRLKIYINNQRVTLTFTTGGGLGSGANIHFNTSGYKNIFGYNDVTNDGVGSLTDMYFSEVIKCDGQVLAPTDFAETDPDTGIWVPKTGLADSLTFGTTGYYYNFADSGDLANDVSGNNNDASAVTNTTQSLDTPSNNFATLNSLDKNLSNVALSEGNLKMTTSATNVGGRATMGVSSGKWFWEVKIEDKGVNVALIGIAQPTNWDLNYVGSSTTSYAYSSGAEKYNNGASSSYGASWTTGDYIGVALNMDDGEIAFYKNGSSQGTAYTGIPTTDFMLPAFSGQSGTDFLANFGNPQFTISSGNTDDNGYGNFEYAPPSGYLSLCSANLSKVLG